MTDFNRLLRRLVSADVEFVIVGGFAAVLHGSSRVTRDLDVCAVLTSVNVEKLRTAFRDLHPVHRIASPRLSFQDLNLHTDLGALDVLGEISGVGDFARVASAAVELAVGELRAILEKSRR